MELRKREPPEELTSEKPSWQKRNNRGIYWFLKSGNEALCLAIIGVSSSGSYYMTKAANTITWEKTQLRKS